jgi:hypothetical protein
MYRVDVVSQAVVYDWIKSCAPAFSNPTSQGKWTPEEEEKLRELFAIHGPK